MKRILSFGIGAAIGVVIVWFVRRSLSQSNSENALPDMQTVAPMTAPVTKASTPQSNGSKPSSTPVSTPPDVVSTPASSAATVAPATDEPQAVEETAPVLQTTRAESDSDVAVPNVPVVEAPTQAETETTTATEGDDLAKIMGIGKVVKQKLNDVGIMTFQQLADASIEVLEEKAGIPAWRVKKDLIQEQAAELARGEQNLFNPEHAATEETDAQPQESSSAAES